MLKVSDAEFQKEVLESDIPVLVDFYADWCAPCKIVTPILEKVSGEYEGQVKFVKVDVDASHTVAAEYGIRGIPTLMIFDGGEVSSTKVGIVNERILTTFIDEGTKVFTQNETHGT